MALDLERLRWESLPLQPNPRYDLVLYKIGVRAFERYGFSPISNAFIHRFVHGGGYDKGLVDDSYFSAEKSKLVDYGWLWHSALCHEGVMERSPRGPASFYYRFPDKEKIRWLKEVIAGEIKPIIPPLNPWNFRGLNFNPSYIRIGDLRFKILGDEGVILTAGSQSPSRYIPFNEIRTINQISSKYKELTEQNKISLGSLEEFTFQILGMQRTVLKTVK